MDNINPTKCCTKCNLTKSYSDFQRDRTRPDGFAYVCKDCYNSRNRELNPTRYTGLPASPYLRKLFHLFSKIFIDPSIHFKGVPCWLWTGSLNKDGYANVGIGGKTLGGHRVMYNLFVEILTSTEDQCDHLCRVRRCVNPAHLEKVDNHENQMRGLGFVGINARKTHCIHGHPFSKENTYYRKSHPHRRDCRACMRGRVRNSSHSRRAHGSGAA